MDALAAILRNSANSRSIFEPYIAQLDGSLFASSGKEQKAQMKSSTDLKKLEKVSQDQVSTIISPNLKKQALLNWLNIVRSAAVHPKRYGD